MAANDGEWLRDVALITLRMLAEEGCGANLRVRAVKNLSFVEDALTRPFDVGVANKLAIVWAELPSVGDAPERLALAAYETTRYPPGNRGFTDPGILLLTFVDSPAFYCPLPPARMAWLRLMFSDRLRQIIR